MSNITQPSFVDAKGAKYTHLHLHTEYSLLDGANKLKDIAKRVKELGMDAVAMTDHGNMFGAIEFYVTMKKAGIKPIIGLEAYLHNKEDIADKDQKTPRFHLCLYAKNEEGYKNLMYLSSQSFIKGRRYRFPRINKKLLRQYSSGLVCSSACLQGEISWHLNTMNPKNKSMGAMGYEGAKEAALEYKDIFGEDFYIEIMRHGLIEQREMDSSLIRLSRETGIRLVATNDAHYTYREDAPMQEVAMCIAMGRILKDEGRLKHNVHEFYIKSPQEMYKLFLDIPETLEATQEIASKCNLEIDLKNESNNPPTPPSFKFAKECAEKDGIAFTTEAQYFIHKCKEGLESRLLIIDEREHQTYRDRLEHEMNVIIKMKFEGYMLIVWDFVNYAKKNKIPVGPGRGSAAGSLVAFCLRITDIDPIKYSLLFERFLNPDRVSMPDIDTDFCQRRRGEILEYMTNRYGKYNVAQVITFGKMLARGVIRDVARVLDVPYKEADSFAKLIPNKLGITLSNEDDSDPSKVGALQIEPKIQEAIDTNSVFREVWEMALKLEGLNRNAGKHAAAVVIDSEKELWNKVPLYVPEKTKEDFVVTQYSMKYLEAVDLIKFDFLGLKTLTVIQDTLDIIKHNHNMEIDFLQVDVNDSEVYKTLRSGDTLGIFQLESTGMQDMNRRLKPTGIDDAIALLALFRPGPMDSGMTQEFIERKNGRAEVEYIFPELEDILKSTYGVIIYQEQVMQIVQVIGGFSLGEADLIRRAMGKKDATVMNSNRLKFADGAEKNGFDRDKAEELFDLIAKFAEYGFNKSHSAAYGMLTFQTAYLKTYYKHEFMAAILTSESGKTDAVAKYIEEAKSMGMEVLPPSANSSLIDFSVSVSPDGTKRIVFGLGAIKGAGQSPLENIIEVRKKGGVFKSLEDFVVRVDFSKITKRILEPLIKSGSLDNLGYTRATMLNNIDKICELGRLANKAKGDESNCLFGGSKVSANLKLVNKKELPVQELLEYEYETIGIYVSGHPLDEYRKTISRLPGVAKSIELRLLKNNSTAILVCKVESVEKKVSKAGRSYAYVKVMDLYSKLTLVLFDSELDMLNGLDTRGPLAFKCTVKKSETDEEEEDVSLRVLDIMDLEECKDQDVELEFDEDYVKDEEGNEIIPLNVNNYKDENMEQALCIVFENTITQDDIDKLAYGAKRCTGNRNLIIELRRSKRVMSFKSSFMVSSKLKETLPCFNWRG